MSVTILTRGAAVASLLLLISGCGDGSGLPPRFSVKGTVTYNGQPVEKGTIEFRPVDLASAQAATGEIQNGSYYLTTANDGDGALPGDYQVVIKATEVDLSKAAANVQGGSFRQDDVAKANKNAKKLIPTKYSLPETSGLTFKVEQKSNTADFTLTD
jgi:hypothetical protein